MPEQSTATAKRTAAIARRLKDFDILPDSGFVSVPVAAAHDGVDETTVRRNYPLKKLSEGRYGVNVGYLRHRGQKPAA
jgi:hypothetical protein